MRLRHWPACSTTDSGAPVRRPWRPLSLEDGLWHELSLAVASPLHEDGGGVVGEPPVLVADERLAQPAQGLGRRLTGGGLALDEPAETLGAEPFAVVVAGVGHSVGVEQQQVAWFQRRLRDRRGAASDAAAQRRGGLAVQR